MKLHNRIRRMLLRWLTATCYVLLFVIAMPLAAQQRAVEVGGKQNARSQYRFSLRVDEEGVIKPNAFFSAKQQLDRILKERGQDPRMDAGLWDWEWLGPGNIGGRIRTIAIHPTSPQTMLIGSATGGLWRTFNGGASWNPVGDFLANLGITSLVFDPTNPVVMYASTGEGFPGATGVQGGGIFKSVDAGISWTQLGSTTGANWQWIQRLSHHPNQPNTLIAATGNQCTPNLPGSNCGGLIQRSVDGGISWTTIFTTPNKPTDVRYHPLDPNLIIVGTLFRVYTSTNGGMTFTNQSTGAPGKLPNSSGRSEVTFSRSGGPGICYASIGNNNGEIWRSLDSGRTWQLRNTGIGYLGTQANYNNTIWVDPTNPNLLVVGGIDLWRSLDGGPTLRKISRWQNYHNGGPANSAHADQHAIVSDPGYNGTTNRIVYFGNDGGIQMTNDILTVDSTSGWINLANGLGITQFYGGAAAPDGAIIVGGTQDNDKLLFRPERGPLDWRQVTTGDGGFAAINPTNINQIFGEGINLQIRRSDDGGLSYFDKVNGLTDAGNGNNTLFISPFSMDSNNPNTLIAGSARIWRTTNSADNWTRIRDTITGQPKCTAIDIAVGVSNTIWVGYDNGMVSRSLDGGSNWTNVNAGLPTTRSVTDIAINPANSSEVIVTFGGYVANTVFLTTNSGTSWIQRTGGAPFNLPSIHVNTVRYHPSNTNWVYIGTDLGVFASEDKGLTWNITGRFASSDGPVNVVVDELFWQGTDRLIAATHGRGMFRSRIRLSVYVDKNNPNPGDGTAGNPFRLLQDGINAQGNGTSLFIQSGVYQQGPILFNRRGPIILLNGPLEIR